MDASSMAHGRVPRIDIDLGRFTWGDVEDNQRDVVRLEDQLRELYAERKAMIIEMLGAGMTRREVGAVWGITGERVRQILDGW